MAIMAVLTILAILTRLDMATDMVVIGVYANCRKNVDENGIEKNASGNICNLYAP